MPGRGFRSQSNDLEQRPVPDTLLRTAQEAGPDAARLERALQLAVGGFALELEGEQVLGGDDVALHADNLGDVRNPALAVAHAVDLADQVNRRGDLGSHCP